jgi:DNA-3-methyladenine glycosylase II
LAATTFDLVPLGPFSLDAAGRYFGGWPELDGDIVMAFPVDGAGGSAAVVMRQQGDAITGEVHGDADPEAAWRQALAVLSLDIDGRGFADVAERDPVVGRLWREDGLLRPVLFHSAYEAAAAFIIGHRLSIAQGRRIRARMAEATGAPITIDARVFHAFPAPAVLAGIETFTGLSAAKMERLQAVAVRALEGRLDRQRLRSMPEEEALAELRTLPGVGPFFASGILARGAGLVDTITDDDLTPRAIELAYELPARPDRAEVLRHAEAWRPFRMWALVLLHVWLRIQPQSVIGRVRPGRR